MSTINIDNNEPSATINFADLRAFCDKLLEKSRRGEFKLAEDEYILLWTIVYANFDGKTATGTSTAAVVTY